MKRIKALTDRRVVTPLVCLAAVIMLLISEAAYWNSKNSMDALISMGASRVEILKLTESLSTAESLQTGYVLTGHKDLLQNVDKAKAAVTESFRVLVGRFEFSPESMAALNRFETAVNRRLELQARAVLLKADGKDVEASNIVLLDMGTIEAAHALNDELLAYENEGRNDRQADVYRALLLARIAVAVLTALSLLALLLYLRQTLHLGRQQKQLVQVELSVREGLESEVAQRTTELSDLTLYLLNAREDERSRLARNLHDDLGSLLTSAKLDAARIRSRLQKSQPPATEALGLLEHLVESLNSSVALGRDIIENLRPSALSNLGLVATLEILAREFEGSSGVLVHCQAKPVLLTPSAELMIYRLVQEALTNAGKYARAEQVWVGLSTANGQVTVTVRDDGQGFDTRVKTASRYGLVGMRFRVEVEGGVLTVTSAPGQGTLIQASLPQNVVQRKLEATPA